MEKETVPAPPPPTLRGYDLARALLDALLNENSRLRRSLQEMEAVKNAQ